MSYVSDKYIQLLIELSLTVKCMRPLEIRRREIADFHFKFAGRIGVLQNPDGRHSGVTSCLRLLVPGAVDSPSSLALGNAGRHAGN